MGRVHDPREHLMAGTQALKLPRKVDGKHLRTAHMCEPYSREEGLFWMIHASTVSRLHLWDCNVPRVHRRCNRAPAGMWQTVHRCLSQRVHNTSSFTQAVQVSLTSGGWQCHQCHPVKPLTLRLCVGRDER